MHPVSIELVPTNLFKVPVTIKRKKFPNSNHELPTTLICALCLFVYVNIYHVSIDKLSTSIGICKFM